jgi:hypothetical protein
MITSTIIFATLISHQPQQQRRREDQSPNRSKEQEAEVLRQLGRVHQLVRTHKFREAESALAAAESYGRTLDIQEARIELALWREDYGEVFNRLHAFFEGNGQGITVSVSGAEEFRVWYWFLLNQKGSFKQAEKVKRELFATRVRLPLNAKFLEPEKISGSSYAQVYMYMAGYHNLRTNISRSQLYIELAKKCDRKVIVDPNFDKIANMCGYKPGVLDQQELSEVIPMLNHTAYEKKLGRAVRMF